MVRLKRIFKDFEDTDALNALVNVETAIGDDVFLTKAGALLSVFEAEGVDHECLDPAELESVTRRFEGAMRMFDASFRVYQYMLKSRDPGIPFQPSENPVVQEAVTNRAAYLQGKDLYQIQIYWVVVYEGWHPEGTLGRTLGDFAAAPIRSLRSMFSSESKTRDLEVALDQARETLSNKGDRLVVELRDVIGLKRLDKRQAFRFFCRLLNYAPHKVAAAKLRYDQFVDFQACHSALECHRDHLRLDNHYVQVLTLKEPPAQTTAHLLKGLQEMPSEFVIASEWKPAGNAEMRKIIRSKSRHFFNSKASLLNYVGGSDTTPKDMLIDPSATAMVGDLGRCLEEIEVHGRTFGEFSLTLVLYDEDRARLSRSVAECFKVCAGLDLSLTEEHYNLLNGFLAVLPGNDMFNLRRRWLLSTNYADLSFLFAPAVGEVKNPVLGTEYLAAFETNHATPYFFNLHCRDIAHSLVLGATGSGKSFLLNFLLTHLQKVQPFTYIFDLGGSYESLTRQMGGTYVPVSLEKRSFSINPFTLPLTADNQRFLLSFLRVLAESDGYEVTAQDERDLHEQIENLYAVEPSQRRLLTLVNILHRGLREQLGRWVLGGPFGAWFDNVEDNLTFSRFQTFDFEGMDQIPQALEPLLFYILHRANAVIYDPALATTFKVFVVEEAWRFLRHPVIKRYIQEGFKTWRKKNAAMILATQSSDDLLRSEMLPVVVESCATKLFLANPSIDLSAYREAFHLNETEAALVAGLVPKQQILIKRPDHSKVVNLNVDRKGYWLYTNNPFDNQKKHEAFERYGFEEGLEILARSPST